VKAAKKPNIEFQNAKKLIQLYIDKNNTNWPKEIAIAKKLLKKYPIEFWEQYDPSIIVYSLSIFLTPQATKELDKEFNLWNMFKPKETIKLEEKPVIDLTDSWTLSKSKSKTIQEFVDEML
jgi:hypothetical protein